MGSVPGKQDHKGQCKHSEKGVLFACSLQQEERDKQRRRGGMFAVLVKSLESFTAGHAEVVAGLAL